MMYNLDEIESVHAEKIGQRGYKSDINVVIKIYIKNKHLETVENIQVKLVSSENYGFNQVEKRKVDQYVEKWHIPSEIQQLLMLYDGELVVSTDYTQKELEAAIKAGEFVLHNIGSEVHVLEDINSMITTSAEQGDIFKDNQTVRVIDSIATSIATVFASKYIGKVPNNESGRVSLWSDIVKLHQELFDIQAIENFISDDIEVLRGEGKKTVVVNSAITVVNTMTKLYMKTVVG